VAREPPWQARLPQEDLSEISNNHWTISLQFPFSFSLPSSEHHGAKYLDLLRES